MKLATLQKKNNYNREMELCIFENGIKPRYLNRLAMLCGFTSTPKYVYKLLTYSLQVGTTLNCTFGALIICDSQCTFFVVERKQYQFIIFNKG